jgi:hypothetical protein
MGGKKEKMIRGLQRSSKQKAAGLPTNLAYCADETKCSGSSSPVKWALGDSSRTSL